MKSKVRKASAAASPAEAPKAVVAALAQETHAHRLTAAELAEQRAEAEAYRAALHDALQHPWRLVGDRMTFGLLKLLSRLSPPLPSRMAARFGRSAAKRDPARLASGGALWENPPRALPSPSRSRETSQEWTARRVGSPPIGLPAKLVAFYLPQFHPIPENDRWWGAGFTEWRNVTRAVPSYPGHFQPHLPADLGFYDLRLPEVMKQQIEFAHLYGVGAFCFYFYWFGGRTLLEHPLRQFLDNPDLEIEFCLCWANENWSRRWDGRDKEVLIAQDHSPEDDLAFIAYVSDYLRDRRNIRIDGKPLLLLYRPDLLRDARATAERWRRWCRGNGVGEIVLAYVQTAEKVDPSVYGFDAAVEFPPNNTMPPAITKTIHGLRNDFAGTIYDWTVYPARSEAYDTPDYLLFRGTTPSWDNTARRGENGTIFHGSTPAGYKRWLQNAIIETAHRLPAPDARLVFINAWNEWAEGAHLEPDLRYGHAYLQATFDALQTAGLRLRGGQTRRVAVVSHDAFLHGAQFLALHIGQFLRDAFHVEVDFILLGKGDLIPRFRDIGQVIDLSGKAPDGPEARAALRALRADGCEAVIANTVVSGHLLPSLRECGFRIVSLVHELPGVIQKNGLQPAARKLAECSDHLIFPAETVRVAFESFAPLDPDRCRIRPQGMYQPSASRAPERRAEARVALRAAYDLPHSAVVAVALAYGDERKGIDLFTEAAIALCASHPEAAFLWAGDVGTELGKEQIKRVAASGLSDRIRFIGFVQNTQQFLLGADIFVLTSREDPFPSVVLEALDAALPVVAFDGVGGFCDLLRQLGGELAPQINATALAETVSPLLSDAGRRAALGESGRSVVEREFSFRSYVFDLLHLLFPDLVAVSVVVPNYNYRDHLEERLASIAAQTYPIREVIVIDDASTDGSDEWLAEYLTHLLPGARLILQDQNSGSVFRQWRRGAELAGGDLVWIAEADDMAEPSFVSALVGDMADPRVVMAYSQSCAVDTSGRQVMDTYLAYVADISTDRWMHAYVADGVNEIASALAVKNTIPNVSAVMFRRRALIEAMDQMEERLKSVRVSGDWLIYLRLLANGGAIAYTPEVLNRHRRHDDSATARSRGARLVAEIAAGQAFAAGLVDLPPETAQLASEYLATVSKELGV